MNQIFSPLQHAKNEVKYLENIFSDFISVFPHMGVLVTTLVKANIIHSIYKNENFAVVPMANSAFEPFDNCRDVE